MPTGRPTTWPEAREHFRADRRVNGFGSSRTTMRLFRLGQWLENDRRRVLAPLRKAWWAAWRTWSMLAGLELSPSSRVGPGLKLRHGARGAVVHPLATIGSDCVLFHNVTIGSRRGPALPRIGDGVRLCAGCIVIGDVSVGDRAVIGAGAVVVHDVPPDGTAHGPAATIRPGPGTSR